MAGFTRLQTGLALILLSALTPAVHSAVHTYRNEYFYSVSDAYIFRGGREGLYASSKEVVTHLTGSLSPLSPWTGVRVLHRLAAGA